MMCANFHVIFLRKTCTGQKKAVPLHVQMNNNTPMRAIGLTIAGLCICLSIAAQTIFTDSVMLEAYRREDMTVWKEHIDKAFLSPFSSQFSPLLYEYGFCGYMVDRDKPNALPYVRQFRSHVEAAKDMLPAGHYEMYLSAVYVYELRLHESIHPLKAMSLARKAVQSAPADPLTLAYYATCLFYAPKPFGSKQEALEYFEKADSLFHSPPFRYCWVREATEMYINQCREKLKK